MSRFTDYLPTQGDPASREKIKIKVYYEMICITKITMIAKTTSVHSQLANSTFLSHTLSCLCSWQQQLLKYLAAHTMNCQPLQLNFHHITMIMWFTFLFEIWKKGLSQIRETKLIRYGANHYTLTIYTVTMVLATCTDICTWHDFVKTKVQV